MDLFKSKPDMRTTTKFSFNVGYVFIGLVVVLVIVGLFNGLITSSNFPNVLDSILYPAVAFFSVGAARVVVENVSGVRRDDVGRTIPPEKTPDVQINDVTVENAASIVDSAANVNIDLPPMEAMPDLPTTRRRY
jgi:hypothetical protein